MARSMAPNQSFLGKTRSLLTKQTYPPLQAAAPLLTARANPEFLCRHNNRAPKGRNAFSSFFWRGGGLPSSTTTNSQAREGKESPAVSDVKHFTGKLTWFMVGITKLTIILLTLLHPGRKSCYII